MKPIDLVFGTVVYPGAEVYLNDFFQSIAEQTDQQFSLLILDEDIPEEKLKSFVTECKINAEIVKCHRKEGAVRHRIQLLQEAKKRGFQVLVIGDCDDVFSKDRIGGVRKACQKSPEAGFYYNLIMDFKGKQCMPSLPKITDSVNEILECNYLGMSNTAINLPMISDPFIQSLYEFEGKIFDWYLYSRLLLTGLWGERCEGTTCYRLHAENTAGVRDFSHENLLSEVEVKRYHYKILSQYDVKYEKLLKSYDMINIDGVPNRETQFHFWWDLIQTEE